MTKQLTIEVDGRQLTFKVQSKEHGFKATVTDGTNTMTIPHIPWDDPQDAIHTAIHRWAEMQHNAKTALGEINVMELRGLAANKTINQARKHFKTITMFESDIDAIRDHAIQALETLKFWATIRDGEGTLKDVRVCLEAILDKAPEGG